MLYALFLFKRPTAKQDGCVAAEKSGGCILRYGVSGFSLTSKWCSLGIACSGDLRNPLMAEKKRENKRKNEEKRDSTSEAALLQIALKNVPISDNNIRAY